MTAATDIRSILNTYLSNIVYLDDQFQIFWQRTAKGNKEIKRPLRKNLKEDRIEKSTDKESEKKQFEGKNLYNFCKAAQKDFSDLTITPLVYEDRFDNDKTEIFELIEKLQSAKLIVMDGFLSEKMHAVDIIKQMKDSQELKLIVVYTAQKTDTLDKFKKEDYDLKEGKFISSQDEEKRYNYDITPNFVLMVCEKSNFDFHDITSSYIELFLNHYGNFPVAFIDVINKIEINNSKYLSTFSKPFDTLMLLQSSSEGLPKEDMHTALNSIILNQIKQDMQINDSIIESIYDEAFDKIEMRLEKDDFKSIVDECLKEMVFKIKKCRNKERIVKTLNNIDIEEYKRLIKLLITEKVNFVSKTREVSNDFKTIYAETYLKDTLTENPKLDLPSVIKTDIKQARKNDLKDLESLIPLFMSNLANKISDSKSPLDLYSMLSVMKTYKYPEDRTKFEDIFCDCYEEGKLSDKAATINKLFAGDIYFDNNCSDDIYLCITPSCHLFRPNKVNNTVQFIKGKISNKFPSGKTKDSEHITFLPNPNVTSEVCIAKWNFHDIRQVDLKQKEGYEFENWRRPYRLLDEYHKQIMSEFNSFYSKIGVQEFFAKSNKALTDILLDF